MDHDSARSVHQVHLPDENGARYEQHEGLGIAVAVPQGWSIESSATFPLQLFSPPSGGYRSNLMFSLERFFPPDPSGAKMFLDAVRVGQERAYPGFVRHRDGEVWVGGHPAVYQHYRWLPDAAVPPLTQVLGLVVHEPGTFLEVDGACPTQLEEEMLWVLDAVFFSVRLIGAPRATVLTPIDLAP